tara:strand:+ start:43 stop:996 length:954 start_codon:yes stop_codon:yes gene_type:complete
MLKYVVVVVLLSSIGYFYNKYKKKTDYEKNCKNIDIINQYLLNKDTNLSGKPILWVHIYNSVNARSWDSFFSRNNEKNNQPYITLCIKSMIKHCGDSFNVCIINDASFFKLIPGWKIDLEKVAEPLKHQLRTLAMAKVLFYYGGLTIPPSTIVLKDLKEIYNRTTLGGGVVIGEMINKTNLHDHSNFMLNKKFLGCQKNNKVMRQFIDFLERRLSKDCSSESEFLGTFSKWFYKKNPNIINGVEIGTRDSNKKPIRLDDLMSSNVQFHESMHCIYIPSDEIIKRNKYGWFARQNESQILDSNSILSKYLALSQAESQ